MCIQKTKLATISEFVDAIEKDDGSFEIITLHGPIENIKCNTISFHYHEINSKTAQWHLTFKCQCDEKYIFTCNANQLHKIMAKKTFKDTLIRIAQYNQPFIIISNKPDDINGIKNLFSTLCLEIKYADIGPVMENKWSFFPFIISSTFKKPVKLVGNPDTIKSIYQHFYKSQPPPQKPKPSPIIASSSHTSCFQIPHSKPIAFANFTESQNIIIVFIDGSSIIVTQNTHIMNPNTISFQDESGDWHIFDIQSSFQLAPFMPQTIRHNITNHTLFFSQNEIRIHNLVLFDFSNVYEYPSKLHFCAKIHNDDYDTSFAFVFEKDGKLSYNYKSLNKMLHKHNKN